MACRYVLPVGLLICLCVHPRQCIFELFHSHLQVLNFPLRISAHVVYHRFQDSTAVQSSMPIATATSIIAIPDAISSPVLISSAHPNETWFA